MRASGPSDPLFECGLENSVDPDQLASSESS